MGCPSSLTRETQQQVSFTTTLGGKRKAFIRRGGRRTWNVDVSVARPADVSTLEAVARGVGPYGWYPPEAVIGNLLSPQAVDWDPLPTGATDTGLVQLPDGTVARTIAATGTPSPGNAHGTYEMVPVRPGVPVTLAGWGLGGIRFTGFWRDALQAPVGALSGAAQSFAGWQWRSETFTPPPGAAFVQMTLSSGTQYARPSVAWGATGRDEGGTGCPRAVLHSPSHSPIALWEGANYTTSAYQVTEVG